MQAMPWISWISKMNKPQSGVSLKMFVEIDSHTAARRPVWRLERKTPEVQALEKLPTTVRMCARVPWRAGRREGFSSFMPCSYAAVEERLGITAWRELKKSGDSETLQAAKIEKEWQGAEIQGEERREEHETKLLLFTRSSSSYESSRPQQHLKLYKAF